MRDIFILLNHLNLLRTV